MANIQKDITKRRSILESEAIGFERIIMKLCPNDTERKLAITALKQALAYAKSSTKNYKEENEN